MKKKKMLKKERAAKVRAQVKSRWYYWFWGAATVSVFAGQIYVGRGFHRMAESLDNLLGAVAVEVYKDGIRYY